MKLFEFQAQDVAKLAKVNNVLIANEMGTGKTYEAIALDAERRKVKGGCTLVIAPLSVTSSWANHFRDLTNLEVVVCNPKKRHDSWTTFCNSAADVFIVHWDVLRLMPELNVPWLHVIADEAHRAQNRTAKQTKALKAIKNVKYKTALSGTPVTNTPDKLWSILNWLDRKGFSSYWRFFGRYVDWETEFANGTGYKKPKGPKNVQELHNIIEPIYVRHTKKDRCCDLHTNGVLPDLPDKYFRTIEVELTPKQRKAYNEMREDMIAWIGAQGDKPLVAPVVIAQLTRLQQFAVAYAERVGDSVHLADPSSKLDVLMEIIEDNPTEQIVVFSQFSQMVKLINERLKAKGIEHVSITGDVPDKLRGGIIDRFQNGQARIFTGTIAAGGVGITLTAASTIVFTDRSWSPALNAQAEDRLHRIGQQNAVQVIDIIANDTVDLGRRQQLEQKWSWIRELLGDTKASA